MCIASVNLRNFLRMCCSRTVLLDDELVCSRRVTEGLGRWRTEEERNKAEEGKGRRIGENDGRKWQSRFKMQKHSHLDKYVQWLTFFEFLMIIILFSFLRISPLVLALPFSHSPVAATIRRAHFEPAFVSFSNFLFILIWQWREKWRSVRFKLPHQRHPRPAAPCIACTC